MSKKITQRDIAESVVGLQSVVRDLRSVGQSAEPDGSVVIDARALLNHAAYLESVSEELLLLITDKEVKPPTGL